MSNKRITDLTELTNPTTDDVLPIVDIATNTTQKVQVGNLPTTIAVTNALATKQDTLVSGTNIKTLNSTSLLGSGNIVLTANPSGVAGAIQFSDGSAFASDATNFFWNNTTKRLGIGTNAPTSALDVNGSIRAGVNLTVVGEIQNPTVGVVNINGELRVASPNVSIGLTSYPARLAVRGSGTTSGTTSLLVQNSSGSTALQVTDDRVFSTSGGDVSLRDGALFIGSNFLTTYGQSIGFFGAPVSSAIVEMQSTTRGFLPPRMTTTQRDAIATPATGLKIYNTTTNTTDTYDGTTWQRFGQQTFIKGSGTTSATNSLLVQNSGGGELLKVADDGRVYFSTVMISGLNTVDRGNGLRINYAPTFEPINFYTGGGYNRLIITNDGNIGMGTISPNASALLDLTSTTQGFLPPRMTTTEKNAIATPASGLVVYDSTTNKLCCYNGSTWNDLF